MQKCRLKSYTDFKVQVFLVQSYLDTFWFMVQIKCHVLHRLKVNDIFVHFQDICSNKYHIYAKM